MGAMIQIRCTPPLSLNWWYSTPSLDPLSFCCCLDCLSVLHIFVSLIPESGLNTDE